MSGTDRMTARIKATGEVFTPTETVLEMIEKLGIDEFGKGKHILEQSCGDGQFVTAIFLVKTIVHKMKPIDAIAEITGVDIMADNVLLCRKRLWRLSFDLLSERDQKNGYMGYVLAETIANNILVGNTLDASNQKNGFKRLEGQTPNDLARMEELFLDVKPIRKTKITKVSEKQLNLIMQEDSK